MQFVLHPAASFQTNHCLREVEHVCAHEYEKNIAHIYSKSNLVVLRPFPAPFISISPSPYHCWALVEVWNPSNGTAQATFFACGCCIRSAKARSCWHSSKNAVDRVDRQNPPPRMMIIPLSIGCQHVSTIPGGCFGFLPSTVPLRKPKLSSGVPISTKKHRRWHRNTGLLFPTQQISNNQIRFPNAQCMVYLPTIG